jgi:hypothetical protein
MLQTAPKKPSEKLGEKNALQTSYQHGLESDSDATPATRTCGLCERDKEKIMQGKSDKKRIQFI